MTQQTTYSDGHGRLYEAVWLTWGEVEDILGHSHEGTAEDDQKLIKHLLSHGAPPWISTADGWIDEHGWGVYGPERVE